MFELLVISISNPLLIGIYKDGELIKTHSLEGKTSDLLPVLFKDLDKEYKFSSISYVNTPGSYMAIKVAYIFLKSYCLCKNIEFKACNGFLFNENSPIKALGKKYFINDSGNIKVDFLEKDSIIRDFTLPENIKNIIFEKDTLPIYNLPAV